MKFLSSNGKTRSTGIKLLFVVSYIILIIYQQKIKEEGYSNPVWSWVFHETTEDGIISVPMYRVIQKTVEIAGIIIIFYYCGLWCTIGLLIAHYLLSFDLLFYIMNIELSVSQKRVKNHLAN